MLKRSFMIVTLLGSMVPMAAFAGNISTRVMTAGGTATMGAGTAQTSAAGTVTKFFGTGKYYNTSGVLVPQVDAGTTVAFAANAAAGYVVSEVKLNGIVIPNAVSPVTVPPAAKGQSVTIKFARQTVAITANAAVGGSVIPGGTKSGIVGTPLTYVFTPFNGASVQSIAGLPSGATLTDPKNALATVAFPYAGPVAVTFTPVAGTNVTMTPSFLAITASAGSDQTVLTGATATLTATSSAAGATFAWTQVGGPSLGSPWTASIAAPTVTLAAAGSYLFQVTATSGTDTATATVRVNAVAKLISVSQTARIQCENCHSAQGVGAGIFSAYSSSIHGQSSHSLCSACHNGTLTGSHPGSVNAASVSKTTFLVLQNGVVGGNGNVVNTGDLFCTTCHNGGYPIPHPVTGLATSCQFCHTTGGTGDAHQLQPAGSVTLTACTPCHTNGVTPAALTTGTTNCTICHNTLQAHLFTNSSTALKSSIAANNCVGCHGNSIHASFANNSGARIITGVNGEFGGAISRQNASGYRSHHIYNGTNVEPDNAQCIACHLEGTVGTDLHTVKIDKNYHMKDGLIHLRSGNTDIVANDIKWNPASPDHTGMDNFCMSCHNAAGAKSVYSNISGALLASAKVQANMGVSAANRPSAKNPFGDLLTNAYDGMTRTQVVAVYEQFDTGNTSHHAVRGKKYTTRNSHGTTGVSTYVDANNTTGAALFTQYSGAVQGSIKLVNGVPSSVRQLFGNYTASYGASGFGPLTTGSRHTLYESQVFTTAFRTLGGTQLGDDSTLHCGDCHSVGQWKPSSALNADGSKTAVTIGAHGSKNEYMLRTSNGTDALAAPNTATQTTLTYGTGYTVNVATNVATNGTYVCYLCHKQEAYTGNVAYYQYKNALTGAVSTAVHMGVSSGNCIGAARNTVGQLTYLSRVGAIGSGTKSSVFGILCLNCHGGNTQIFGGIHGNSSADGLSKNVGYKCYSTNGKDAQTNAHAGSAGNLSGTGTAEARNAQLTVVTRKPYRFAGGSSLKFNGGGTADKWEARSMTKQHREGCYNLATDATGGTQWSATDGSNVTTANKVPDYYGVGGNLNPITAGSDDVSTTQNNGTSSGWGSCNHHQGSNKTGSDNAATRMIQRPLNY